MVLCFMLASASFFGFISYLSLLSFLYIPNSSLNKTAMFLFKSLNLCRTSRHSPHPSQKKKIATRTPHPSSNSFLHAHAGGLQPFHWLGETTSPVFLLSVPCAHFCHCIAYNVLCSSVSSPMHGQGRDWQFYFCVPSTMPCI